MTITEYINLKKKTETRGGARTGAGRPTNEVKSKTRTVKLTDAEYKAIVAQYGGFAKGVRSLLDN